jgi:hypothetical protein
MVWGVGDRGAAINVNRSDGHIPVDFTVSSGAGARVALLIKTPSGEGSEAQNWPKRDLQLGSPKRMFEKSRRE